MKRLVNFKKKAEKAFVHIDHSVCEKDDIIKSLQFRYDIRKLVAEDMIENNKLTNEEIQRAILYHDLKDVHFKERKRLYQEVLKEFGLTDDSDEIFRGPDWILEE